jgi:hypothetical protein
MPRVHSVDMLDELAKKSNKPKKTNREAQSNSPLPANQSSFIDVSRLKGRVIDMIVWCRLEDKG